MPLFLKPSSEVLEQAEGIKSVLIVPCRFCPAASLAIQHQKPYIELLRRFLRTGVYEAYIKSLVHDLKSKGIKTAIFDSKIVHQFFACLWTKGRRNNLAKKAAGFDAVLVLGCEGTVDLVREAIDSNTPVISGMDTKGIMNVQPKGSLPLNISLELKSVTPV